MALGAGDRCDILAFFLVEVAVAVDAVHVNGTQEVFKLFFRGEIASGLSRFAVAVDAGCDIVAAFDIIGGGPAFVMMACSAVVSIIFDMLGVGKVDNAHAMLFKGLLVLHCDYIGTFFKCRIEACSHKKTCNAGKKDCQN